MAGDSKHGDTTSARIEAETSEATAAESAEPPARAKRASRLRRRSSIPPMESSLDQFIERANQHPIDVSPFDRDAREQALRDKIAELQDRLAAAEARAEAARSGRARRWAATLGAFVVGGACTFAIVSLRGPGAAPSIARPSAPSAPEVPPATAAAHDTEPAASPTTAPAPAQASAPAQATAPDVPPTGDRNNQAGASRVAVEHATDGTPVLDPGAAHHEPTTGSNAHAAPHHQPAKAHHGAAKARHRSAKTHRGSAKAHHQPAKAHRGSGKDPGLFDPFHNHQAAPAGHP